MTKKRLVEIAGLLWLFAGSMVTKIGLQAYGDLGKESLLYLPLTVLIFGFFYLRIFSPLVEKNIHRIDSLAEGQVKVWRFLDKKSYIMMASMMSLGMILRKFSGLPALFFFIFYIGLGMALFLAGVQYFWDIRKEGEYLNA